jgi:cyclophilin family peptidyl-prolyl cis-trans isomerase
VHEEQINASNSTIRNRHRTGLFTMTVFKKHAAILLFLFAALVVTGRLMAAESAARAEFDKVYAQYKDIVKQMYDLRDHYTTASPDDRPAMEKKFNDLLRDGNTLRPKVLAAAEKAYLENPKDETIGGMMLSVANTMIETDDYEGALRIAQLLIEHNFADSSVYNVAGAAAYFTSKYDDAEKYLKKAQDGKLLTDKGQEILAGISKYREKWARELKFRESDAKSDLPRVKLTIGDAQGNAKGDIVVELFENEAPNTVANFLSLVGKKFYDGTKFHRVIGGFMAQGGDPEGTGMGGPGYRIPDEFNLKNHREHFRGALSMASTGGPDTAGSQFFICFVPKEPLDGHYGVFGRVVEGMDELSKITRTHVAGDRGETPIPGIVPDKTDKIIKAEILPSKREHSHGPKTLPERK